MRLTIAFAFIIILAGCSNAPVTPSPAASPTSDEIQTSEPWPTVTFSPTPTTEIYPNNPWNEQTLVVAVSTNISSDRDYTSMVREAAKYWGTHSNQYAEYPIDFEVVPNASDPDIVVNITRDVAVCGLSYDQEISGCARLINQTAPPQRPETAVVEPAISTQVTIDTIKHELGHLIGVEHGQEPTKIMSHTADYAQYFSEQNLTERDFPWIDRQLTIAIDEASIQNQSMDRETVVSQVRHAIQYHESRKSGEMPDNVTLTLVNDTETADISIHLDGTGRFTLGKMTYMTEDGSQSEPIGMDIDDDRPLEFYTDYMIIIKGIDDDAVGWHVGLWLSYALGADSESDLPPPFIDASYSERRSEWWE